MNEKFIEYKTIKEKSNDEFVVDKSRFIGYIAPVSTQEDAENFINSIKKMHYNATHNCWAYVLKTDKSQMKQSDDGEPSGTAGVPILEVIKKEDLTNVAIVVTRYFGGIKLGAGGLIRAYTNGAKIAIDSSTIIEKKIYTPIYVKVDYSFVGKITNHIENNNFLILPPDYTDTVTFKIHVPKDDVNKTIKDFTNMTNGTAIIDIKEDIYVDKIGNEITIGQ